MQQQWQITAAELEEEKPGQICAKIGGDGHLSALQWLHANGCQWDSNTCASAAKNGHLVVLQWLHANGCQWNSETYKNAAEHGHLSVLQWARALMDVIGI